MKYPVRNQSQKGYALVLVLSFVVLVTAVLVAFLMSVGTERSASGGFAATVTARQMADSAVALVQAQINDASTQGTSVAWVSQPGMVRTYDSSGSLVNAYKLYSGPDMVAASADTTNDLPGDAKWVNEPGMWTDLNAPITVNGAANFPIVDPSAREQIGDVAGLGISEAKGFGFDELPGATDYQEVPMPVRWLYVLQDGKMVSPTAPSGRAVSLAGESKGNPVVGRVAFWTDDESAKVNINTASEGSYWDTPRGFTSREVYDLALKQPAYGEYNRFPGHPATVSLSAVLPITPLLAPLSGTPDRGAREQRASELATRLSSYLELTPRYRFGGSQGGTVPVNPQGVDLLKRVDPKGERLYANLDEMIFDPARDANPLVTREVLESRRFFLTAHSRAPETTLFNTPRIASWPIWKLDTANQLDLTRTNAYDRTIALCASTGTPGTNEFTPYFFQRADPYDPKSDYDGIQRNQELYTYLQNLTGGNIPGFGGDFLEKYPDDRDSILTQIFDYVRITNLYDDLLATGKQYTQNYYHTGARTFASSVMPIQIGDTQGQGRYYGLSQLAIVFLCAADGSEGIRGVDPEPGSGAAHDAWLSNDTINPDTPANQPDPVNKMLNEPFPNGPPVPLARTEKRVQAMIVPTFFSTMMGWQLMRQHLKIEIEGLQNLQLEDKDLQFPAQGEINVNVAPHNFEHGAGGYMPIAGMFSNKRTSFPSSMPLTSGTAGGNERYPFISAPITVPATGMRFNGGGPITVKVYMGNGASAKLIQTGTMTFPTRDQPQHAIPTPTLKVERNKEGTVTARRLSFFSESVGVADDKGRLTIGNNGGWNRVLALDPLNEPRDVARALVAKEGDFRLSGAMTELTVDPAEDANADFFKLHPYYDIVSNPRAIMLDRNVSPDHQLVSGTDVENPLALPTLNPANLTGDFDNGPVTVHVAGAPAANKPDEGQVKRQAYTRQPSDQGFGIPYYSSLTDQAPNNATFFSPNRIMPSPVMFGSLPTGVKSGVPWRTLLFRPAASHETVHTARNTQFPGAKDHLLLDLFWMPVVEPYAISDRFSTAGKVNMNYQILPFTHIERSAPMRAVLKNEMLARIPSTFALNSDPELNLKEIGHLFDPAIDSSSNSIPDATLDFRQNLDVDQILSQFTDRFDQTDKDHNVFISASEICDLHMVAEGETVSSMPASWTNYRLTGDNMREKIYASVYQKLTTKSNTYTVHFRAQSLKKVPGSPDGVWTEGRDQIIGEYRGSTTIERFINPDATFPDYATASLSTVDTLDKFYRWRVISNKQFAP